MLILEIRTETTDGIFECLRRYSMLTHCELRHLGDRAREFALKIANK